MKKLIYAILGVAVIGGGIAGLTAALDAAEAGLDVILIEKSPYLGGRVAGFHNYFPKLCPPSCGLAIGRLGSWAIRISALPSCPIA